MQKGKTTAKCETHPGINNIPQLFSPKLYFLMFVLYRSTHGGVSESESSDHIVPRHTAQAILKNIT